MRRSELMRRCDLMKPDLLSEILLLASGIAIFVLLLLIVLAFLTHGAAQQ